MSITSVAQANAHGLQPHHRQQRALSHELRPRRTRFAARDGDGRWLHAGRDARLDGDPARDHGDPCSA
ncbi:MAG: hypothetical protein WDO13_15825 [Verrucomicrobiota bacterium]